MVNGVGMTIGDPLPEINGIEKDLPNRGDRPLLPRRRRDPLVVKLLGYSKITPSIGVVSVKNPANHRDLLVRSRNQVDSLILLLDVMARNPTSFVTTKFANDLLGLRVELELSAVGKIPDDVVRRAV